VNKARGDRPAGFDSVEFPFLMFLCLLAVFIVQIRLAFDVGDTKLSDSKQGSTEKGQASLDGSAGKASIQKMQ
jgi:hypothetical protein